MQIEQSILVDRPAADVFAYVSHIENCVDWVDGCIAARQITPGEPRPGSVGVETVVFSGQQLQAEWTITDFTLDAVCTYENEGLPGVFGQMFSRRSSSFRTDELDGATRLTYQVQNQSTRIGRLLEPLLARLFRRNMRRYLQRIKVQVEQQGNASKVDGPLR